MYGMQVGSLNTDTAADRVHHTEQDVESKDTADV